MGTNGTNFESWITTKKGYRLWKQCDQIFGPQKARKKAPA